MEIKQKKVVSNTKSDKYLMLNLSTISKIKM